MQITEITVSWNETCSLGNYSNIRPGLTLKATIGPDEDPGVARDALMQQARTYVQELVDEALEAEGSAAKYSKEPRYNVYRTTLAGHHYLLIIPAGVRIEGHSFYRPHANHRVTAARHLAAGHYAANEYTILESLDGDLTAIYAVLDGARAEDEAARQRQAEAWEQERQQQIEAWEREQQAPIEEQEAEIELRELPGVPAWDGPDNSQ